MSDFDRPLLPAPFFPPAPVAQAGSGWPDHGSFHVPPIAPLVVPGQPIPEPPRLTLTPPRILRDPPPRPAAEPAPPAPAPAPPVVAPAPAPRPAPRSDWTVRPTVATGTTGEFDSSDSRRRAQLSRDQADAARRAGDRIPNPVGDAAAGAIGPTPTPLGQ